MKIIRISIDIIWIEEIEEFGENEEVKISQRNEEQK